MQSVELAENSLGMPRLLAYGFAKRYGVVALYAADAIWQVFHRADTPVSALLEVRRWIPSPARFAVIAAAEFERLLQQTYEHKSGQTRRMVDDLHEQIDLSDVAQHLPRPEDLLESDDEAPIIRLINALLAEAIRENASDIHIETYESRMVVRFRVDGVLREIIQPQREFAPMVISRLKVMAKLDIAEKRLPQDGRISLQIGGRNVDVRVSTLPSGHGERVVLRLLDKQANQLDLAQIGMAESELAGIRAMIARPHGIVLVTGPTGSGKTTSLYAIVNRLNQRSRNILTVEDPIEYYLDGIGQTQVNAKVDMTFAKGLRAILRQDPDVVMVGEIRDRETAEIAVQASLTGHLVLSTLHTNTAVGAITRLRDMGVEPFLLASSLVGVIAQRLVRLLCPHCKQPVGVLGEDLRKLGYDGAAHRTVQVFEPKGCQRCFDHGYKGRAGIFEIVPVDAAMVKLIHDGAADSALERHARTLAPSIQQSALHKVLSGATSMDEALRMTLKE
ncbi:type II secretion system ATPase GspE [Methylomonas rhizoryzae]|uniref:type II secretion system ATPase GspE n=1 Tax=Methylomonas rhizoryzae TaxID=2608981 RepID=UPI00123245F8|nr:type II secretion system ATPase GspE [Methylomonas rhizoryzae]